MGCSNNNMYFSQFCRLGYPRSRCWQDRCPLRWIYLLVCQCLLYFCILKWCAHTHTEREGGRGKRERTLVSFCIRALILSWGLAPYLQPNLITSHRYRLQMPLYWILGLQHMNFERKHSGCKSEVTGNIICNLPLILSTFLCFFKLWTSTISRLRRIIRKEKRGREFYTPQN